MFKVSLEETLLLQTRTAYTGTNPQYIGYAQPGISDSENGWLIQKFEYNSSSLLISKKFAGGKPNFDKCWNNRAEYSYA